MAGLGAIVVVAKVAALEDSPDARKIPKNEDSSDTHQQNPYRNDLIRRKP
jgi:hypothetical protein